MYVESDEDNKSQSSNTSVGSSGKKRLRDDAGSSSTDAAHTVSSVLDLAHRLNAQLYTPTTQLPIKQHRQAMKTVSKIKECLCEHTSNGSLRELRMLLLYAGLTVRKYMLNEKDGEVKDDLGTTMALLFVLQLLVDRNVAATATESVNLEQCHSEEDALSDHRSILSQWRASSFAEEMNAAPKYDWETLTVAGVCQGCIAVGRSCQTMQSVHEFASLFFETSALMLTYNLIGTTSCSANDSCFLALATVTFLDEANNQQNLESIVDLAESEAGQQIVRDLILSYMLPRAVVGVRRHVLMSRQSNALATEQHTTILQEAHEAAMRGASWEFTHNKCPIIKACCLLAGFACAILDAKGDIRKDDAFNGLLKTPFLETPHTQSAATKQIVQLPASDEWCVVSLDKRGRPITHLRDFGLNGLGRAVLCVIKSHTKIRKKSAR